MKDVIVHPQYGEIVYEESFWTGKKNLYVGGVPLSKLSKNSYIYKTQQQSLTVELKGNIFSGVKVIIEGEIIQVSPPPAWYAYVFAIVSFLIPLVWGNSAALCAIIPLLGGALGGALGGVMAVLTVVLSKQIKTHPLRILFCIGMLVGHVLLSYIIVVIIALAILA